MEHEYELKTSKGIVIWNGKDGLDACNRWADSHRGESVYAWREISSDLRIGMIGIIE